MAVRELDRVLVPRRVVLRGARPVRGQLFRVGFATTCALLGFSIPIVVGGFVVILGMWGAWATPRLVDRWLERTERTIDAVDADQARAWKSRLETQWVIAAFAPHAWVALQQARLSLTAGEPRTAATELAECARMAGEVANPALVEARAHALLLADDRRLAAEQLRSLSDEQLTARGRLDLAIASLSEGGGHQEALVQLERAAEQLEGHPRWLAALAVAHARAGDQERAVEATARFPKKCDDPSAADLMRRARKHLRGYGPARANRG